MADWLRAFGIWWNRRRRLSEEWSFHLSMARSELESLGMSLADARRFARRRLGRRRAAMRETGGDLQGLIGLLPIRRTLRSAWLAPCLMAVAVAVALAFNPYRWQVLESLYRLLPFSRPAGVERLIPLTPAGEVPIGFASWTLWALVLVGIARIAVQLTPGGGWRICTYAAGLLCEIAMFGCVVWATGLQILLGWSWGSDGIQGMALLVFLSAYAWSA
jgi:hypothetical protein